MLPTTHLDILSPAPSELAVYLHHWQRDYSVESSVPATRVAIEGAEKQLGPLPQPLRDLYLTTNGLWLNWFTIFPLEEPARLKHTWDGLVRNNQKFNRAPAGFLAFATLGEGNLAYIRTGDESLWFDDAEGLALTESGLVQFIEACLKDAQ